MNIIRRESFEHPAEDLIRKMYQCRARAPRVRQCFLLALKRWQAVQDGRHQGGIATAKSVDRLLHVSHPDDMFGAARKLDKQRELNGARILKLIHHEQV